MKKSIKRCLPSHLLRGNEAESLAEKYLAKQGLKAHGRNYRCSHGEIDLVMTDADTLVFIEVRYRGNSRYGSAVESVTAAKIRRIRKTAEHYLLNHSEHCNRYIRFDVIAMTAMQPAPKITWIKDAF